MENFFLKDLSNFLLSQTEPTVSETDGNYSAHVLCKEKMSRRNECDGESVARREAALRTRRWVALLAVAREVAAAARAAAVGVAAAAAVAIAVVAAVTPLSACPS